ncbi:hypothetical protein B0O99DRAFT_589683 [Bisporella sp. PMI_857]|nr:hypothetical protein B0O99DRAFT_589683 [Bisporella sp. PMI_857]
MRFLSILGAVAPLLTTSIAQFEDPDICLQRNFLSAPLCADVNPAYTNETLPAFGWYCCWYQGPFAPPPAVPTSAWLTFDENGAVANRCLGRGTCVVYSELPEE